MKLLLVPLLGAAFLAACSGGDEQSSPPGGSPPPMAERLAPTVEPQMSDFQGLAGRHWSTDFTQAAVAASEFKQGQIKDGIPAIDQPKFLTVAETTFLKDQEPVIAFEDSGEARAYPLQILIWHEIVNDVVGGRPVLITFCPLCNTAIAFDRTVNGRVLDFGVSGFLRNSDLVMYDRQTESWWQQVTGEALVGQQTGTRLELLASSIVAWADFREAFPDGMVLSRETGHRRQYGVNPYVGYDDINSSPFLFDGRMDSRLAAMERVVTVELEGEIAAYPFSRLESKRVVHDAVGGQDIVVLFKPGTVSALDLSSIADSRDIGAAAVFSPMVEGRGLTFRPDGNGFKDAETGSTWDIFGKATAGPLQGRSLTPIVSGNHFWFAWAAFKPETRVWGGP